MKVLVLSNQEAEFFPQQDKMVLLRLLGEQPSEEMQLPTILPAIKTQNVVQFSVDAEYIDGAPVPNNPILISLRYPSGEYGVKETWWCYGGNHKYYYKADSDNQIIWTFEGGYGINEVMKRASEGWRSPVTMPAEAIRWTIKVETTVKRVSELSIKEISTIFCTLGMFVNHWNALHAKPVLTKDKTGYFCYPYDIDGFERWLCPATDKKYYKGKPLTIYANPGIEVISVVKVQKKR